MNPGQVVQVVRQKDYGFNPWSGHIREATDRCFSLTSMLLPLSFSLSKINKHILGKDLKNTNHAI